MDMLQSVMEASSQAMFTLDREGTITHINHQTKDYFGLFNHSRHSHGPGRLEPGDLSLSPTPLLAPTTATSPPPTWSG